MGAMDTESGTMTSQNNRDNKKDKRK